MMSPSPSVEDPVTLFRMSRDSNKSVDIELHRQTQSLKNTALNFLDRQVHLTSLRHRAKHRPANHLQYLNKHLPAPQLRHLTKTSSTIAQQKPSTHVSSMMRTNEPKSRQPPTSFLKVYDEQSRSTFQTYLHLRHLSHTTPTTIPRESLPDYMVIPITIRHNQIPSWTPV